MIEAQICLASATGNNDWYCKDCGGRCTAIEVELKRLLKRRRVFFKMSTCVPTIAHNPSQSFATELAIIKKINLLTLSQM